MCLGIPGQITQTCNDEPSMAMVNVSGINRKVNIACVIPQSGSAQDCIGDWVLVHVGFAMSRIDEKEAEKTLALLAELGDLGEELDAMQLSTASTLE